MSKESHLQYYPSGGIRREVTDIALMTLGRVDELIDWMVVCDMKCNMIAFSGTLPDTRRIWRTMNLGSGILPHGFPFAKLHEMAEEERERILNESLVPIWKRKYEGVKSCVERK